MSLNLNTLLLYLLLAIYTSIANYRPIAKEPDGKFAIKERLTNDNLEEWGKEYEPENFRQGQEIPRRDTSKRVKHATRNPARQA